MVTSYAAGILDSFGVDAVAVASKLLGGLEAMVNRLSELANFLDEDSLPLWLRQMLAEKEAEIRTAMEHDQSS